MAVAGRNGRYGRGRKGLQWLWWVTGGCCGLASEEGAVFCCGGHPSVDSTVDAVAVEVTESGCCGCGG